MGTGCVNCKILHDTVKQAITELGVNATIIKVEDVLQIMTYNILSMPCLVVDEKIVSAGKKLSVVEVKEFLTQ